MFTILFMRGFAPALLAVASLAPVQAAKTVPAFNRDFRLSDVHGKLVKGILT